MTWTAWATSCPSYRLIVTPRSGDGLRRALGEAHRRCTRRINFREGWRGHLWQGRFASFAMDERHLLRAARYVERNPVRARLCRAPWRWRWSSAAAHEKKGPQSFNPSPLIPRAKAHPTHSDHDQRQTARPIGADALDTGGRRPTRTGTNPPAPRPIEKAIHQKKGPQSFNSPCDGELDHLQKCLKRGTPFGDRRWTLTTAAKLKLESTLKPKGRPKKCTALL